MIGQSAGKAYLLFEIGQITELYRVIEGILKQSVLVLACGVVVPGVVNKVWCGGGRLRLFGR